jgi:hypothetical protein
MLRGVLKNAKSPTIRMAMVAVALIAAVLAVVANERWRWGYPKRVLFERGNAVSWLETVARSDYRMYDRNDVASLMRYVASEGLLVGESKPQVESRLGIPFAWKPPPGGSEPTDFHFLIGLGPLWNGPGPPELCCCFNADGKCVKVIAPEGVEQLFMPNPSFEISR